MQGIHVQEQINTFLDNFYRMYILMIGRSKMNGTYPVQVGRAAVTPAGFQLIAKKLFEMHGSRLWSAQLQCWPQWLLVGTTLSRGQRVGELCTEFLGMREDMMDVEIPTSKSDGAGMCAYPKKIAANMLNPYCDCFLALGIIFFCRNAESSNRIFPSEDPGSMLNLHLRKILDDMDEAEQLKLGCHRDNIGTHSAKKYGATLLYDNETTVAAAIEKRCDHQLNGAVQAYVGELSHQDAFNARLLAGLKMGDDSFSSKPAHLECSDSVLQKIPWAGIVGGYEKLPMKCKQLLPCLLAAVIKNEFWLRENLKHGGGHPLLFSPLFTTYKDVLCALRPHVRWGLDVSDMTVTGVTLAAKTHAAVSRMEKKIDTIQRQLEQLSLVPIDACAVETGKYRMDIATDKILAAIAALQISGVREGSITLTASTAVSWSIGNFPSQWRVPTLHVAALWRAWFVVTASGPALRTVVAKMMPSMGKERLADIRHMARIRTSMECLQGRLSCADVYKNVEDSWAETWKQCKTIVTGLGHTLGSESQSVGTFYNWLSVHKDVQEALRDKNRPIVKVTELASMSISSGNGNAEFFDAARIFRAEREAPLPLEDISKRLHSVLQPTAVHSVGFVASVASTGAYKFGQLPHVVSSSIRKSLSLLDDMLVCPSCCEVIPAESQEAHMKKHNWPEDNVISGGMSAAQIEEFCASFPLPLQVIAGRKPFQGIQIQNGIMCMECGIVADTVSNIKYFHKPAYFNLHPSTCIMRQGVRDGTWCGHLLEVRCQQLAHKKPGGISRWWRIDESITM